MNYLYALAAAALFGASTPVSKTMLTGLKPFMLASLCYFGSGLALAAWKLAAAAARGPRSAKEPSLSVKDWPYVAGFILAGGVLAPVLLFKGLLLTTSSGASIMLNLELIFTSLIAWVIFKEHTGGRFWAAAALVVSGAVLLSVDFSDFSFSPGKGALLVALSAFFWGLDNNLTAKLSVKDPVAIALIKGLAGGSINLALAFWAGELVWSPSLLLPGLALGAFSYGASLVLFIKAMRGLGAARSGAVFGAYPFFGAALSVIFLKEPLSGPLAAAFILMALGFYLVVSERHGHEHEHGELNHEHLHAHDDLHHSHAHGGGRAPAGPHTHPHAHTPASHTHEHLPDTHHRHRHY
jgi:drug/metabolite transporter (DMT)-like permease